MKKTVLCKSCGAEGHYAISCRTTARPAIKVNKRPKQKGKIALLWDEYRANWFETHTAPYYDCYICGKMIRRDEISLDHVIPRSNAKAGVALRFTDSNIKPSHLWCNKLKGSRSVDAMGIVL